MRFEQPALGRLARVLLGLTMGIGVLLGSGARDASAGEPGLRLKVSVIQATKEKSAPDPALARIQGELAEAFAGYQGFKRLQAEEKLLAGETPVKIDLPNGESAEFKHQGVDKNLHKIRFSLTKSKVNLDLKAPLKKMFYQAGMKHGGGILILAMYIAPVGEPPAPDKTEP
jgi:hypothetical protein